MAQYNTFFIPHGDTGAQQETLNAFLRAHRVLKVEKCVFPEGWAFCVEWMDGAAGGVQPPYAAYQREKIDYMKVLPPEVFARFSELRKRRKEIADADGVKPFVVMTDAQLAKAAEFEKPTVADLRRIDGFGEAKAEKYGARLLAQDAEGADATERVPPEAVGEGRASARPRDGETAGLAPRASRSPSEEGVLL